MKFTPILVLILAFSASGVATAQSGAARDKAATSSEATRHRTTAVVKAVDIANGKVKLAHEPVKSLNWPAMTMNFFVKDPALFDQLSIGKKVEVEFIQEDSASVITAVK
ncbi:MAG TPA: copper-binding protein [Nitrosospira sp.]|nr:copper-binding protein [Nitrosospira sp.]